MYIWNKRKGVLSTKEGKIKKGEEVKESLLSEDRLKEFLENGNIIKEEIEDVEEEKKDDIEPEIENSVEGEELVEEELEKEFPLEEESEEEIEEEDIEQQDCPNCKRVRKIGNHCKKCGKVKK